MKFNLKQNLFEILCVVTLTVLTVLFFINTRLFADDLLYFTFARHGFSTLISNLQMHYEEINARLLIHFIFSALLSFNSLIPIIAICVLITLSTFFFSSKLLQKGEKVLNVPLILLIGFTFFLMGDYVLVDGAFWLSGFFNYVLPLMLLCIYLYFLQRTNNKINSIIAIVFAFLCSISTEIYGAIVLVLTLIYLIKAIIKKEKIIVPIICLVLILLGITFLFSSPGIQSRLLTNSDIGLIKRGLILLTVFSQMTFERAGLAVFFSISALSTAICSKKVLKNKFLFGSFLILALFFTTSVMGIVFPAYFGIILYVLYSALLLRYGILLLKNNETIVFNSVATFGVSLGVACASGVVSHRVLFIVGVSLLAIFVRSIVLMELSHNKKRLLIGILGILCIINTSHFFTKTLANAKVWDDNKRKIEEYESGDTIYLLNDVDECYFRPSFEYYPSYYLPEFGVDKQIKVKQQEKMYYSLMDENGATISDICIKRGNSYYIPIRVVAEYIGADVEWQYDMAKVTYNEKLYKFKSSTNAVMTKDIGGYSFKTKAPLIIVNERLHVPLEDVNSIFNLKLIIKE